MKNNAVQGLRGYLMIWIVLFHYTSRYPSLYPSDDIYMPIHFENGGDVGIVIFFIISGFFLAKGLYNLEKSKLKFLEFCKHKYMRLWPSYIVSIILIFVCVRIFGLPGRESSITTLLIDALFIYHPIVGYVDLSHWFIAHLIFVQCFLGFMFSIVQGNKKKIQFRLLIISFNIFFVLLALPQTTSHTLCVVDTFIPFKSTLAVLIGVGIYQYSKGKEYVDLMLIVISVCILMFLLSQMLILVYSILFYMLLNIDNIVTRKIFQNKLIIEIGNMSFYWYLIHQNIGYIFLNEVKSLYGGVSLEYWIPIVCIITFALGYIVKSLEQLILDRIYGAK